MKAVAQALNQFVGSFGLPAFTVNTVPKDVSVPYLTYPIVEPEWNQKAAWYIQGWYRTTDHTAIAEKADEIIQAIGTGVTIKTAAGYLVIYPESPLVQIIIDGDHRSFYISLSINSYQMPGYYPEPEADPAEPGENPEEGENE